jgi:hypothetical protein
MSYPSFGVNSSRNPCYPPYNRSTTLALEMNTPFASHSFDISTTSPNFGQSALQANNGTEAWDSVRETLGVNELGSKIPLSEFSQPRALQEAPKLRTQTPYSEDLLLQSSDLNSFASLKLDFGVIFTSWAGFGDGLASGPAEQRAYKSDLLCNMDRSYKLYPG